VQRAHVVGAADVELPAVDEHAREKGPALEAAGEEEVAKLGLEGGVHGHVALVHAHAVAAEDGAHGAAVLECAPHCAEAGEVKHHRLPRARRPAPQRDDFELHRQASWRHQHRQAVVVGGLLFLFLLLLLLLHLPVELVDASADYASYDLRDVADRRHDHVDGVVVVGFHHHRHRRWHGAVMLRVEERRRVGRRVVLQDLPEARKESGVKVRHRRWFRLPRRRRPRRGRGRSVLDAHGGNFAARERLIRHFRGTGAGSGSLRRLLGERQLDVRVHHAVVPAAVHAEGGQHRQGARAHARPPRHAAERLPRARAPHRRREADARTGPRTTLVATSEPAGTNTARAPKFGGKTMGIRINIAREGGKQGLQTG
jgi:hypothetical protein